MATQNFQYDHPAYLARHGASLGANTANTNFPVFTAFTALKAYSATFRITTAGTSAGGNLWVVNKIGGSGGTTTTALATATLGTAAAGTVVNVALSTETGGASLVQGDTIVVTKGTDTVGVSSAVLELGITPLANVTA